MLERALKNKPDDRDLHEAQYEIDFMEANAAGMAQQMAWSAGKTEAEGGFLAIEADTAAYSGQLKKARDFPAKRWLQPRPLRSRKPRQDSKLKPPYVKPSSVMQPTLSSAPPRRWALQRTGMFSSERRWRWLLQGMRFGCRR